MSERNEPNIANKPKRCRHMTGSVFYAQRAQQSTHLLAGESPVTGGAKPPCS